MPEPKLQDDEKIVQIIISPAGNLWILTSDGRVLRKPDPVEKYTDWEEIRLPKRKIRPLR
jgi:streptogramin lyase